MVANEAEMIAQSWWELAERAYQHWGYLVFGSMSAYEVGCVVNHVLAGAGDKYGRFLLPQPFRIMGPGTREEYLAQGAFVGLEIDPAKVPRDAYFYRAVTE